MNINCTINKKEYKNILFSYYIKKIYKWWLIGGIVSLFLGIWSLVFGTIYSDKEEIDYAISYLALFIIIILTVFVITIRDIGMSIKKFERISEKNVVQYKIIFDNNAFSLLKENDELIKKIMCENIKTIIFKLNNFILRHDNFF